MSLFAHGTAPLAEIAARKGEEVGVSGWVAVTQEMIDSFATTTRDEHYIHVDPARAAADSPFGGTIAHGFLTLSLLAGMGYEAVQAPAGAHTTVNYGLDRVRFIAPVRSGGRVRGRFALIEARLRSPREAVTRYNVTIEIEGGERPALVADWTMLHMFAQDQAA